jgi:hypothetical protein
MTNIVTKSSLDKVNSKTQTYSSEAHGCLIECPSISPLSVDFESEFKIFFSQDDISATLDSLLSMLPQKVAFTARKLELFENKAITDLIQPLVDLANRISNGDCKLIFMKTDDNAGGTATFAFSCPEHLQMFADNWEDYVYDDAPDESVILHTIPDDVIRYAYEQVQGKMSKKGKSLESSHLMRSAVASCFKQLRKEYKRQGDHLIGYCYVIEDTLGHDIDIAFRIRDIVKSDK